MFDFSDENKEKYYIRAEEYLAEHDLRCFQIDRERFGLQGLSHKVKIYFVPFSKQTVHKDKLIYARSLEQIVITNDRFTKRKKGAYNVLRENGYVELDLDEEDC